MSTEPMPTVLYTFLESPIGNLLLVGDGERLSRIGFPRGKGSFAPEASWRRDDTAFMDARAQLRAYFGRELHAFDLQLAPVGTPFQKQVWQALTRIPWGTTASYGEVARGIGRPAASRAVGAANGANPLPIVVPCHRVIGASGALTGFGGGIDTKKWLLALETESDIPPPLPTLRDE
ncbi:methylated-DNA--[protein]-cysteine S-methyltransferase [Pseudochelatococcus lubricantis]|uniref:methylated-DNA--[protein]-cysteine S-methyltransferase n=1 Tax=Pseudochelatococcus lubricantis TaxID=1538102 RepID=UPI0035ECE1AD